MYITNQKKKEAFWKPRLMSKLQQVFNTTYVTELFYLKKMYYTEDACTYDLWYLCKNQIFNFQTLGSVSRVYN